MARGQHPPAGLPRIPRAIRTSFRVIARSRAGNRSSKHCPRAPRGRARWVERFAASRKNIARAGKAGQPRNDPVLHEKGARKRTGHGLPSAERLGETFALRDARDHFSDIPLASPRPPALSGRFHEFWTPPVPSAVAAAVAASPILPWRARFKRVRWVRSRLIRSAPRATAWKPAGAETLRTGRRGCRAPPILPFAGSLPFGRRAGFDAVHRGLGVVVAGDTDHHRIHRRQHRRRPPTTRHPQVGPHHQRHPRRQRPRPSRSTLHRRGSTAAPNSPVPRWKWLDTHANRRRRSPM